MPVIIVSSDDFSQGREIAHRVAGVLGYRFLDRELLDQVAKEKQLSREELEKALDELPGLLTRRSRRQRLLSFIEAACLEQLLEDNVVAFGLAAHLYVRGVSHVVKVRIINEPEQWAKELAQAGNLSLERARKQALRQTEEQRRWSQDAYQLDQTDPSLYDLVISLGNLEQDKAVEFICDMAGYRKFQPMTYSQKLLQDKALAAQVRLGLMERFPEGPGGVQRRNGGGVYPKPEKRPAQEAGGGAADGRRHARSAPCGGARTFGLFRPGGRQLPLNGQALDCLVLCGQCQRRRFDV